jgi:hypothetical protein
LNGESIFGENLGEPRNFLGHPKFPPDFIKGVANFDFEGNLFKEARNFGSSVKSFFNDVHNKI